MQHEFVGLVREARAPGPAVFLSSHVLSEVQRTADRVVVLRAGRVVARGHAWSSCAGGRASALRVWLEGAAAGAGLRELPGPGRHSGVEDHRFTAAAGRADPAPARLPGRSSRSPGCWWRSRTSKEAFLDLYEEAR